MPTNLPSEHLFLAFGIPSLDRLMGTHPGAPDDRDRFGYALADEAGAVRPESATFCIIGPDGTGKSNYALHLAADYWRRTAELKKPTRIIYASSDLSHERAEKVWQAFWLDRPVSRRGRLPFETGWKRADTPLTQEEEEEARDPLKLRRYTPSDAAFSNFLVRDDEPVREVAFLDLESATSGDDWAFLHSLLAVLGTPARHDPRHLLVIDAVEGLETLVGERDAFGQLQSRRARIAQIVRAAADKCHLAFVVEEPKDGERLPEVFVSDIVVRLRSSTDRDYARRTVELEKVRGQRHIRGQHDFRIRQERSTTGPDDNPDDPAVGCRGVGGEAATGPALADPTAPPARMAYIQVFPSLHYLTRDVPRDLPAGGPPETGPRGTDWRYAAFGLYQLDSMLWQAREPAYKSAQPDGGDDPRNPSNPGRGLPYFDPESPETQSVLMYTDGNKPDCLAEANDATLLRVWDDRVGIDCQTPPQPVIPGFDMMGLPAGTVTTLIGSDSTYKTHLAMSLLGQCFRTRHVFRAAGTYLPVIAANEQDNLKGQGVAILLATYDTDRPRLRSDTLVHHLIGAPDGPDREFQKRGLEERLIVRALEPHHLPSALFVHLVRQLVEEAKRRLSAGLGDQYPVEPDPTQPEPGDEAEKKRLRDERRKREELRHRLHGRIRLVIDDWSTLLAMYPEVQRDPLVLPYLMAYLRREGVTALILATRPGNPDDRGTGPLDQDIRELRLMADHHLHTWHVSFFDERRVAVTVLPSPLPGAGSLVRELRPARAAELPRNLLGGNPGLSPDNESEKALASRMEEFHPQAVTVDPHFELYSGLPDGQPTPVPLQISLFAEREGIPAFQSYLGEINDLFGHLFGHNLDRTVLRPKYGSEYEHLRELSYLQSEARLTHTLVLQVDEFWAESRSELLRQERYLMARTVDAPDLGGGTRRALKTEDPFGLFTMSDALAARVSAPSRLLSDPARRTGPNGPLHRYQFFDLIGYDLHRAMKRYPIDKVPYSWDFGFLVCNRALWHRARHYTDHRTSRVLGPDPSQDRQQTVERIWVRLWKIANPQNEVFKFTKSWLNEEGFAGQDDNTDQDPEYRLPTLYERELSSISAHWIDIDNNNLNLFIRFGEPAQLTGAGPATANSYQSQYPPDSKAGEDVDRAVTWREFFGACKAVAKMARHEHRAFDMDLLATESFSCLVLEVWFSEVRQALNLYRQFGDDRAAAWADDVERNFWKPSERRDDIRSAGLKKLLGVPGPDQASDQDHPSWLFRRALYRTMLLLDEVIGRDQLSGPSGDQPLAITPRPADPRAVASRHWYSTASLALADETASHTHVVVGLPGRYAVRGDWFLAVARGSRSARLGERAIDILSSRRANIVRLQTGIGLPVRDLFGAANPAHTEERTEYWTPLAYADDETPRERISYRDLRKLGAFDPRDGLGRGRFSWLWRSSIDQYDIHSRMWQKWLVKTFHEWRDWPIPTAPVPSTPEEGSEDPVKPPVHLQGQPWWDGFVEYDHYLRWDHLPAESRPDWAAACYVETRDNIGNERWDAFSRSCDALIEGLRRASNPPDRR